MKLKDLTPKGQTAINEAQMIHGVDYSTLKLKSNIDQKWKTLDDMEDDLTQYIAASRDAGVDIEAMTGLLGAIMEDFDKQDSDSKGEPYLPRKSTQY